MHLNQLLGIRYPIIQGAMANIATGTFAAAVSNAGGLGIIAAGGMNYEGVKAEILACKALTDKPFGVNIMLLSPHVEDIARLVIEQAVPVVTTGAGSPAKYVADWKTAGIKVIPVVPSVALAKLMEKQGVFAVIAEGTESGGHVGETTTMALVPQVVSAISLPVIAAGGIASGQQLAAAACLGACGAQIGTCLLVSEECPIHDNYKNQVLKAGDLSTVVTGRSLSAPVRVLRNHMARTYIKMESTITDRMELEHLTLGSLRKAVEGDVKMGSLMAGQVAGSLKEIRPLATILEDMMAGYHQTLASLKEVSPC